MPTTGTDLRRAALAAALALGAAACARAPLPPPAEVVARALATRTYSAELSVRLRGPELRARARALVAFERPHSLRVEVPGPTGARFVLVARGAQVVAVFPAERAVYRGGATAAEVEALLGVGLVPSEIMDVLAGRGPERLVSYRAWWGERFPERIEARLADGGRLDLRVRDVEAGQPLPMAVFEPPPSEGYRAVGAAEARRLWTSR